jgi:hypothetical protein
LKSSLGVLLWQVMNAKPLPETFDAQSIKAEISNQKVPIKSLLESCLVTKPTQRANAFEVAQWFLDQYNDACAKIENLAAASIIDKCRSLIDARRIEKDKSKEAQNMFSISDTKTLLELDDLWGCPESNLRLAPQASFLIGAGIF